ncbi:shikimate dehydrogenase [Ideonella sp. YS5]|uniref:shikimate dehydrogenase n=1 Tax=Ideonella sp. YS5 TaxID=3453714 RepID=UPI003EECBBC9
MPSPAPESYAVIGNPVAHSRSPFIHQAFAEQTGQHMSYGRVLAPLDGFESTVRQFAAGGGQGCNVTVPFKFAAFAMCSRHSARAALAEAVNTVRFDEQGWFGDNTDGVGLLTDIERNAAFTVQGRRVLLVGAGGAAAGVMGPLIAARPAEVVVANRTRDKAAILCGRHGDHAATNGVAVRATALEDPGVAFDLVINASASSLAGAAPPVPASALGTDALAVDLMYGPAAEGFLRWARAHGARGRDGLGMLVEQAAEAFELWRGVRPDTAPVLAALRGQLANEAAEAAARS